MITPRDLAIVRSVAHYYCLTRTQISRLHFPGDHDGRLTRKRLQLLLGAQLVNRTHMQVVNPAMGAPAPVYYPSQAGCAWLSQELKDESFLRTCTQTPNWQHLYHWTLVTDVHILLDQAAAQTEGLTVEEWLGEWSIANPQATKPEERFRLYVLWEQGHRVVFAPDAAALLHKDGYRKVVYFEIDRDTTKNAQRVAAQGAPGVARLAEQHLHCKHFPTTNLDTFAMLMIAPTEARRISLAKAFADKPRAELWRFAALPDLTPATFLDAPVFHACSGETTAIVRPSKAGAP